VLNQVGKSYGSYVHCPPGVRSQGLFAMAALCGFSLRYGIRDGIEAEAFFADK
jgi:hypothetical protein